MSSDTPYISIYDQRIQLVSDALRAHSKLGKKTATELAAHVLHVLDRIPEKVR